MLPEIKQRIEDEIAQQAFFDDLKENIYDFRLIRDSREVGNIYELFSYTNDDKHRGLKIYYHADTNEYRVSVHFGLNEFCLTEYFTEKTALLSDKLQAELYELLRSINEFDGDQNVFVDQKKIPSWAYAKKLPTTLEGFELFISPNKYLEVTNGSFVIINYCDFAINSDLAIYYNIFSDNFGSEARINGAPTVIYDFDSDDLQELEEKLERNLAEQLKKINSESEIRNEE